MKNLFFILSFICAMNVSALQAQEMKKGMSLFNTGLGLVPGWGINTGYDYGLVDTWGPGIFTIGGYVGYGSWRKSYKTKPANIHPVEYRVNVFAFAPRVTYRYAVNSSFEVYGAMMVGAIAYSYSKFYDNKNDNFFAIALGCRYSFRSNFAVFAETGNCETSYLNGGISYSF